APNPHPAFSNRPHPVGYQRQSYEFTTDTGEKKSRQLDLWYPTSDKEERRNYRSQIGFAAENAPVQAGAHPLILFSHGFLGSSDQVIFLTESCARAGYVVAAMNHEDALLNPRDKKMEPPRFADFDRWNDQKYRDRHDDIV